MSLKQTYREFSEKNSDIRLFSQPWWLDAICGKDNWNVVLVQKGGDVFASMPYVVNNKLGMEIIKNPPLTHTLEPYIKPTSAQYSKQLANEKDLMFELIDQLPRFISFCQTWNYQRTNWLPFFWRGYEQTTYYTYVIDDLTSEENMWRGLQSNIRTDIKKALRLGIEIKEDIEINDFLNLNEETFLRQGRNLPYSRELVERLDNECKKQNVCKSFTAMDSTGRFHSAVYIVWDKNSAYYLMGGGDPCLRNSGATSLCLWEAIKFSSTVTKCFDFEGSMIESIERFFRAFGAKQKPYYMVYKNPRVVLKNKIKNIAKKVLYG